MKLNIDLILADFYYKKRRALECQTINCDSHSEDDMTEQLWMGDDIVRLTVDAHMMLSEFLFVSR